MEALSRKPRPWTTEERELVSELRAQGEGYRAIAEKLGRQTSSVHRIMDPEAAAKDRARDRRRYWSNPAKNREKCRLYKKENAEKQKEYARFWREANMNRSRESAIRWRESNRDRHRENNRRRKSMKRASRLYALSPVTLGQVEARYRLFGGRCAYCESGHCLSVDHVLPLTLGGLDECSNIVPACRRCNSSKGARPVEDWYRRQPFFMEERWRKIQRQCPASVAGQLPLALG